MNMRTKRMIATALMLMVTTLTIWANLKYLAHVYEYRPAPGQFINTMPIYRLGEPADSVLARCQQGLCARFDTTSAYVDDELITRIDTIVSEEMVSLGGYGGYIIVGFDHPVVNMHTWDFEIEGNYFISEIVSEGGSSEPGIVMVGVDADGDGVPSDGDRWYELAGSEYNHPKTQHNYTITYYRPDEGKPRTPSPNNRYLNDTTYIRWTSNDVNPDSTSGYILRNTFHNQPYWPMWLQDQETLTFTGTKLRCNGIDTNPDPNTYYFVQYPFEWGYVDNLPNYKKTDPDALHNPGFKIDWAVDENGNHVDLAYIDFIKVYSAVNQYCGWLGETSTEIGGGYDFHPDAVMPHILPGDVNEDGNVNISDVNVLIGLILAGVSDYPTADVNGDGSINITDINAVIALILG